MRIFIGYDSREDIAFEVAKASILQHTDAEDLALRLDDLREMGFYWRAPDPMSETEFSFSRFLVPALCNYRGRALFMDCDFLVRHSLKPLFEYNDPSKAVWVVKHQYEPTALTKMDGQAQRSNALVIAQICQRLGGIPLAIELAAARVRVLTVEQILKRLDDRFNLLTGGLRTALPRHQTLRATIEWSYDLLSEKERLLFHRNRLILISYFLINETKVIVKLS